MARTFTTSELAANPKARLLARLMSDISEEYWCAGWFIGTEYRLWADLTGEKIDGREGWGISTAEREELRAAHELARGWIVWPDDEPEMRFLTTEQWLTKLSEHPSS